MLLECFMVVLLFKIVAAQMSGFDVTFNTFENSVSGLNSVSDLVCRSSERI